MIKKIFLGLYIIIASLPNLAHATDITALNKVESLKVKSKIFENDIEYNVTLPASYYQDKHKDKKYFIIFDLHPRSQPFLSGLHDWMSHNGSWPWLESIVVTPSDYNPEFAKLFDKLVSEPSNHSILDYFESDLLNAIDINYRTNGFRIYNGFMSNGAFGLYTLLNRPQLFNAYIISSPTLADDFGEISSDADNKLSKLDDTLRFLYLSTGSHRYENSHLTSFNSFEEALKKSAPKSLDWQTNIDTKHNYMSRPIISVINAIEALFDDIHTDLKPDSEISKKGVDAIIKHYEMISSKKYGFEVSAQGSLKSLAKSIYQDDPEKALIIYKKVVNLYPESAYALSSLAKAYADLGEVETAVSFQQKAVEKSKTMIQWHQNKHLQYLNEFEQQLKEGSE